MAEALAQGYLGREAEGALKGCGISISGGDIAWLHGDELLVGLEVRGDKGGDKGQVPVTWGTSQSPAKHLWSEALYQASSKSGQPL